ncbi:RDD family protein [Tenacibaculum halocynthiae]|uniref:RDD family protein n=1 Tax=Tenacibaculum halocynthiae TaxID=1254437 RepID=UPI003893811C
MKEIITSSKFEDKQKLASVGSRILAFLIDFFIFWILTLILGMFFGEPLENEIGLSFNGLPVLGVILFAFLLWPISEGITGQTIGKRILSIKVINKEYRPIGIGPAFGRFFFGIFDLMSLIGIIIALINKKNQRIGDIVACTIVVNTKNPS